MTKPAEITPSSAKCAWCKNQMPLALHEGEKCASGWIRECGRAIAMCGVCRQKKAAALLSVGFMWEWFVPLLAFNHSYNLDGAT